MATFQIKALTTTTTKPCTGEGVEFEQGNTAKKNLHRVESNITITLKQATVTN
jgi:hypothetical protein